MVSLGKLCGEPSDLVFVDHIWLDELVLMHIWNAYFTFSTDLTVPDSYSKNACIALEQSWLTHSYPSISVKGDQAFKNNESQSILQAHAINVWPVPPRKLHAQKCHWNRTQSDQDHFQSPTICKCRCRSIHYWYHWSLHIKWLIWHRHVLHFRTSGRLFEACLTAGTSFLIPLQLISPWDTLIPKKVLTFLL